MEHPVRSVMLMLIALVAVTAGGVGATHAVTSADPATIEARGGTDDDCGDDSRLGPAATADALMADRYHLGPHPGVTLPRDLTWKEDPLHDRQWRYRFHMLRFVNALVDRWQDTGRQRYLDRGLALIRSWIAHNPRRSPATSAAWANMVTAWRAITMVCVARRVSAEPWLTRAIIRHGEVLASPSFYVRRGNHALNQAIGLLRVACHLGRRDWRAVASERIERLVTQSVDKQGVSDEQSIKYELYVYNRFQVAVAALRRCGMAAPGQIGRIGRMPTLLAHATRPDGHYEMLGDTDDRRAKPIAGTVAEFAATAGRRGPRPSRTVAVYRRGYAFGRTGWGTKRSFEDEGFFSLRFGPGYAEHAHDDGGSVTLYGQGAQLLVDPGFGDANRSAWERYFSSRHAHNGIVVQGRRSMAARRTELVRSAITRRSVDLVVRVRVYPGIQIRRQVVFSRALGYLIIADDMISSSPQTYRQLWHLHEDARPVTEGRRTWTRGQRGNLLIEQLVRDGTTRVHRGETDPLQGWVSRRYGHHTPASVVERRDKGRRVRFVTVLVPFGGGPRPRVTTVALASGGFTVVVTVGGRSERVRATRDKVTITDAS